MPRQIIQPSVLPQKVFQTRMVDENGVITPFWVKQIQTLPQKVRVPSVLNDTHAKRLTVAAAGYPSGTLFQETDRRLIYVASAGNWIYLSGVFATLQSSLPNDFGANDLGVPAYITDFNHLLMWTGAKWQWYPGEDGSDRIVPFVSGPDPSDGWQACDGSTDVPVLKSDGSLDFVTVPNTAGSWYRQ